MLRFMKMNEIIIPIIFDAAIANIAPFNDITEINTTLRRTSVIRTIIDEYIYSLSLPKKINMVFKVMLIGQNGIMMKQIILIR